MKAIRGITLTSEDLAEAYLEQIRERQEEPEKWRGLQFGHSELDEITGGIRKGEFVVVAGAQKAGKTTVALDWAQRLSKQVQPEELVLFVSLEMSHDSLAGRVLANLSDVEVTKFRDYKLNNEDWEKVERGAGKLKKLPVLWNVGAYSIDGIEQIVEEYQEKIRVVVVDYFQLMFGNGNRNSKRFEQLEEISLRLKRLTLNYNLSVIAISQQNREALKSIERQKDPNTMAGTQSLARDCDLLLLILPYMVDGEEVPHMRKIHIALARNSTVGVTMDAVFSGAYCRFGAPANLEVVGMPEDETRTEYWDR
jgi:replicative DNA helicase